MTASTKLVRLFISSTFNDFHPERNFLQEKIFPRIRSDYLQQGIHFQPIDLRWGVSQEASNNQRTLAVCFEEVKRCRETSPALNFMVLLGERYGSLLPPETVLASRRDLLFPLMTPQEQNLFKTWYQLDENAIESVYVLQPRIKPQNGTSLIDYTDYKNWKPLANDILEMFQRTSGVVDLKVSEYEDYFASATELEIQRGLFHPRATAEPLYFVRTIHGAPTVAMGRELYFEQDNGRQTRLEALKDRLSEQFPHAIHEFGAQWGEQAPTEDHLQQFGKQVFQAITAHMEAILAESDVQETPIATEKRTFQAFAEDRTRHFEGRMEARQEIKHYLATDDPHLLIVTGVSGSGKSSLVAQAAKEAQADHPQAEIIEVYIGITPDSSNTRSLLESLAQRIAQAYGQDVTTLPTDENGLMQTLPILLENASTEQPIIIFVDALDQLRDDGQRGLWLPLRLPEHVHLVVSFLAGTKDGFLNEFAHRHSNAHQVYLNGMTRSEGKTILTKWLTAVERRLQPAQEQLVLDGFEKEGLPLYLQLAFGQARQWPSYLTINAPHTSLHPLKTEIPGLIGDFFERLSDPSVHGKMLVERTLGYLAAARNGLSEDEMLEVLSQDSEVISDVNERSPTRDQVQVKALPVVLWSRLRFDLAAYLTEHSADGGVLLGFYHQQVDDVAETMYLQNENGLLRHRKLATYFTPEIPKEGDQVRYTFRQMAELPFQQTEGELWDALYTTLTDFRFLEQKAAATINKVVRQGPANSTITLYTGVFDLQADFERAKVAFAKRTRGVK